MRIHFSIVGTIERHDDVYVDLPAVPREGETVDLPGLSQADTVVRTVVWYPLGDAEGEGPGDPFAYVVLGQRRR